MADFKFNDDGTEVVIHVKVLTSVGPIKVCACTKDRTGTFWDATIIRGQPALSEGETARVKADARQTAARLAENERDAFDEFFARLRR